MAWEAPTAVQLYHVRNYCADFHQTLVSSKIFKKTALKAWRSLCRPPSKKYLGTKPREAEKVPMVRVCWDWLTSTERGLTFTSRDELIVREPKPGYPNQLDGCPIKPMKVRCCCLLPALRDPAVLAGC